MPSTSRTDILERLESLELPLSEFDHAAHVQAAWSCLRLSPLPEALIRFRDALKRFAGHHGKHGLYHETITFAFMLLIHERLCRTEGADPSWPEFVQLNADLLQEGKALLGRAYSDELLSSPEARRRFRLPDLPGEAGA